MAVDLRSETCRLVVCGGLVAGCSGRQGPEKAITATARKLAVLLYRMIRFGKSYVDKGEEAYERQLADSRLEWLERQAPQAGYILVADRTGEVVS